MYVKCRFALAPKTKQALKGMKPKWSAFSEFLFYRTYSRVKPDGSQENWGDCVVRVIEGIMSIRKDHYIRNFIAWDESYWRKYAHEMAISLYKMQWMPPGRGCWAMGSSFIYERGALALYNCAFTVLPAKFYKDLGWGMDALMNGVGVGFDPTPDEVIVYTPEEWVDYIIPDSREGWVDSVETLCRAFLVPGGVLPIFDYSLIRPAGEPIRGFGGVASGPDPLERLHKSLVAAFKRYKEDPSYDSVRLKADCANFVGCCVVAGNVRRSAEILLGSIHDDVFLNLKNYERYPERAAHGWMSNNSVRLLEDRDFHKLDIIAEGIRRNGEPGYINMRNFPLGRIGKDDGLRRDRAIGINPCGEIPLEDKEVCNLSETFPTRCASSREWLDACEYAAFYSCTVSLLPTHRPETNSVIARNRRIGVSIADFTGWEKKKGITRITTLLRAGYKRVFETATNRNSEAGVPAPVRYTTMKPGGTIPRVADVESGCKYPAFEYILRRVRVARNSQIAKVLIAAGVPYEPEVHQPNETLVFEFPIKSNGAPPAGKVSLWKQAINLALLQREWADNAVSNTLNFKPAWVLKNRYPCKDYTQASTTLNALRAEYGLDRGWSEDKYKLVLSNTEVQLFEHDEHHEEENVEAVLAYLAPITKSVSLLPHTPEGVYAQMPESELTKDEYEARVASFPTIDWSKLSNWDGMDEKYCDGDFCHVPNTATA